MNAVENDIRALVDKELAAANERFPQFHSAHEGYAVIQEEVDELKEATNRINGRIACLWDMVRFNNSCEELVSRIYDDAINAACEAIQVAAMCKKFLEMEEEKMTIGGWIIFLFIAVCLIVFGVFIAVYAETLAARIATPIICGVICIALLIGMLWYYNNTASGQRALVDQESELSNGMERVIRVYTANGDLIAEFEGKIDIEGNDGGYVLFDYQGKRYTYYNCFVESIAEIGG